MKINEKDFNRAVEEWIEDNKKVAHLSHYEATKEFPSYKKILSMSYEALPLIRKLYDKKDSDDFPLSSIKGKLFMLVEDIVGQEFQIPKERWGNIRSIEHYTKNWLDDNLEYLL